MLQKQREPDLRAPCLLVVEDECVVRLAIAEYLRERGFSVVEAVSAEDARSVFLAGTPIDLVFCDVQLPGSTSGIELARELQGMPTNVPIILTSGSVTPPTDVPCACFVPKPYLYTKVADLIFRELGISPAWNAQPGAHDGPEQMSQSVG